jgi:hypothetical protein
MLKQNGPYARNPITSEEELLARLVGGSQRSSENTSNQHTANYDFLKLSYAEGTGISASRASGIEVSSSRASKGLERSEKLTEKKYELQDRQNLYSKPNNRYEHQ